jgi:hypothetical protein
VGREKLILARPGAISEIVVGKLPRTNIVVLEDNSIKPAMLGRTVPRPLILLVVKG